MMPVLNVVGAVIVSYLIGAIPTAYIFGRALKGIDIRQHGSGNVGATNAFRILGKGPGTAVLLLDVLKGAVVTSLVADLFGQTDPLMRVILGIIVVCGHNWTVFLNFKGGKGIATSLGVLIGLTIAIASIRPVVLYTFLSWIVTFLVGGYVSLASIIAAIILPVLALIFPQPFAVIMLSVILCVFVVLRHRPNITRLLERKEGRVRFPWHSR
ncbi:MAG: glycerol-3-phosphate 1-O-acyltransferase PlsY [Candidatus Omnitrophica bacterium]|nr:glycerol-3-phosphate 1-O-acyltransferase PlsY [Candidatus Omnitrophota bacterium]